MKFVLAAALLAFGHSAFSSPRAHDPQYGDCSFACKEIPLASEVMRKFGQNQLPQLRGSRIKILAWNIYKGGEKNFARDFSRIAAGKDIVMLSEAITADPVKSSMLSLPGFGWDFAVSFFNEKTSRHWNCCGFLCAGDQSRFLPHARC